MSPNKKKTDKEHKAEFAKRLNQALNDSPLDIPPKGEGRQTRVAKLFNVGQKAARKWLEGEGFPELEKSLEICERLEISIIWLLQGRGEPRVVDEKDALLAQLLAIWFKMPAAARPELLSYGKFLVDKLETATTPRPPDQSVEHLKKPH
jgi:transcriptional regulator with XRE-family HTH domain